MADHDLKVSREEKKIHKKRVAERKEWEVESSGNIKRLDPKDKNKTEKTESKSIYDIKEC